MNGTVTPLPTMLHQSRHSKIHMFKGVNMQDANVRAALVSALHTVLSFDEQNMPSPVTPAATEDEAGCLQDSTPAQGFVVLSSMRSHSNTHSEHGIHEGRVQFNLRSALSQCITACLYANV